MKRSYRKTLVLLIAAAMLLTMSVGSTAALLQVSSDPVENVFMAVKVDTKINETFTSAGKSSITVENKQADDNMDVYVRVAVVGNWVKGGKIVEKWTLTDDYINTTNWVIGSDDFYYYKRVLEVGDSTENLLKKKITQTGGPDGANLEVTVVHQAIQYLPTSAVTQAWGVTVAQDGTISK